MDIGIVGIWQLPKFNWYGELGVHAAYVYNDRLDYPLNGVALGANGPLFSHHRLISWQNTIPATA